MEVISKMAEFTNVKTFLATKGVRYRGSPIEAHLIVGTPGTILDVSMAPAFCNLLLNGREYLTDCEIEGRARSKQNQSLCA